jgi:putative glutamine amidotransferase
VRPYRPLVAVAAYSLGDDRVARWPHGGYGVPTPYVRCLRRAGARVAIVSPGEPGDPEEILEPFDGLLLVGGGDVDPARYGAAPGEHVYGVEPDRDELEISLLHAADRMGVPTLCICRGMQVMNVAFGGTLYQHLPDVPGMLEHGVPVENTQTIHEVRIERGSKLIATMGDDTVLGSSHHHQGVDRVGDGLVVTGRSSDGLVEAIERDYSGEEWWRWMVGVEWHPEDTAQDDRSQQSLFEGLVLLARLRGSKGVPGERVGRTRDYVIEDYDPDWPAAFDAESARIGEALGDLAVRIEHVGSTSVPGLPAKPIIDVGVSVASLVPRAPIVERLEGIGFTFQVDPGTPDHLYFKRNEGGVRKTQVHVSEAGGDWERRHLAFRDWLRSHPEDAAAYAELKRRLASEHPNDILTYTESKGPFVDAILDRASAAPRG